MQEHDELSSVRRREGLASIAPKSIVSHDDENNWELHTQQVPAIVTQRPLPKFIHPPPPEGSPALQGDIRIFPPALASPAQEQKVVATKMTASSSTTATADAYTSFAPTPSAPPLSPPKPSALATASGIPSASRSDPNPVASSSKTTAPTPPQSPKNGASTGLPFYIQTIEEAKHARAIDMSAHPPTSPPPPVPSASQAQPLNLLVPTAAMPKRSSSSGSLSQSLPQKHSAHQIPPPSILSASLPMSRPVPAPVPAVVPIPLPIPLASPPPNMVQHLCGVCQSSGWYHSNRQHPCLRPHFCPLCSPCASCGGTGVLLSHGPAVVPLHARPLPGCGFCSGRGRVHIQPQWQCSRTLDCTGCGICGYCAGRGLITH